MKYQFHVNLLDGKILGLEGPFTGTSPDLSIFRHSLEKKVKKWKLKVLGDKGYIGSPFIVSPLRQPRRTKLNPNGTRPQWHRIYDLFIRQRRVRVERSIGRFKRFGVATHIWRHPIKKHREVMETVAKIINLHLEDQPLFRSEKCHGETRRTKEN